MFWLWLLIVSNGFQYLVLARTTYARVVRELNYAWPAPRAVIVGVSLFAGLVWPLLLLALSVSWVNEKVRARRA